MRFFLPLSSAYSRASCHWQQPKTSNSRCAMRSFLFSFWMPARATCTHYKPLLLSPPEWQQWFRFRNNFTKKSFILSRVVSLCNTFQISEIPRKIFENTNQPYWRSRLIWSIFFRNDNEDWLIGSAIGRRRSELYLSNLTLIFCWENLSFRWTIMDRWIRCLSRAERWSSWSSEMSWEMSRERSRRSSQMSRGAVSSELVQFRARCRTAISLPVELVRRLYLLQL